MVQLSPVVRLTRLTKFKIMYQKWFSGTPKSPPYNHIVQIGDPVLRRKAKTIDPSAIPEEPMQKLLSRLYHVMRTSGIAGLSAPQLGVSLRVFAIQFPSKRNYEFPLLYEKRQMEYIPLQVWINPQMKILDYTKVTDEESCESMVGYSAELPRYTKVLLTGLDHEGKEKKWEAKGWSARIVQHEMDHLEGKFYTDLMNPETLCCVHWDAVNKMEGRIFTTYMINK
uniref:Peptide deformylase n=4 Tax=Lygus hesperus TaxID=30085 RepID=A0A0A9X5G4_LYGHE